MDVAAALVLVVNTVLLVFLTRANLRMRALNQDLERIRDELVEYNAVADRQLQRMREVNDRRN
jgi:hypothetical protein